VISSSPTDVQPVLDVVASSAVRLCEAVDATILLREGDAVVPRTHAGPLSAPFGRRQLLTRDWVTGRAVLDGRTVHVPDLLHSDEFPAGRELAQQYGHRATLAVPLLREGGAVGAILVRRQEPIPFTDKQIALLQTFADQAVIAIENVRLFTELQARNAALTEALDQQTATAEILRVISSSPTDVQPVLDAVAASAARLCGANDALIMRIDDGLMRPTAHFGDVPVTSPTEGRPVTRQSAAGRAALERRPVHIHDASDEAARAEYPETFALYERVRMRTVLATPLLREDTVVGVIVIRRLETQPFTDAQIALVQTFADQAAIAIENVRLFEALEAKNADLTEALDQQTATAEILRVISGSPTDVQPVMKAVAEAAARLTNASRALIGRVEGGGFRWIATNQGRLLTDRQFPIVRALPSGRAILDLQTTQEADLSRLVGELPHLDDVTQIAGVRTALATPLLREGAAVGVLMVYRTEVKPFTDKQVALLQTFADQAVIAIENVRLFKALEARNTELTEALDQQTATGEVLRVISSSPTDIQPVFQALLESAARLCEASNCDLLLRIDGERLEFAAMYGQGLPPGREPLAITPGLVSGRAVMEGRTVHVPDLSAVSEEYPDSAEIQTEWGHRTVLAVPLLRERAALGVIFIRRLEVRPFSDKQVRLLETFAAQAVIAIENVRLFKELEEKNRTITEALDQQTATAEILRVISSSPTDVQPVLDAVAENATRVCEAGDGAVLLIRDGAFRVAAHYGTISMPYDEAIPVVRGTVAGRAVLESGPVHVPDLLAAGPDFPEGQVLGARFGNRTTLATPLLREGTPIGALLIRRTEVRPFTDRQVALLQTFADQAVIAIENVRLFTALETRNAELTEALDQQTATGEVLRVISSSPTDIQPVFHALLESAARLCDASNCDLLLRSDGDRLEVSSTYGQVAAYSREPVEITPGRVSGRALLEGRTIHVHDLPAVRDEFPASAASWAEQGQRTVLAVPLLRERVALGVIFIRRREVRPFSDKQVRLLETFAAQAVIAIENVRLFKELEARNSALTESLEQQTATAEILRVISSSPTDLQPVMDTVAENAARVCGAMDAAIFRIEGDQLRRVAQFGSSIAVTTPDTVPLRRDRPTGRAILDRQIVHIEDLQAVVETEFPTLVAQARASRARTMLAAPLVREGASIGAILIRRAEVRPFTDKQIALLQTFADQAVIAIENVRLFKELEEKNRAITEALDQQTATGEILRAISSSPTDAQPVFDTIVRSAVRLLDGHSANVLRLDGDELHLAALTSTSDAADAAVRANFPISLATAGAASHVIQTRSAYVVADIETDPLIHPNVRRAAPMRGFRSMLMVPMVRHEQAVGVIYVTRQSPGAFSDDEVALLQTFADQAVIAIENVRLFQELQARTADLTRSVGELRALGEVGQTLSATLDLPTVLTTIVTRAVELAGTSAGMMFEFEESESAFRLRAAHNMDQQLVDYQHAEPVRLGEGAVGQAVQTRSPVQIEDLRHTPQYASRQQVRQTLIELGYRSVLAVPLLVEERILGALVVFRRDAGGFAPATVDLLRTFGTQSALAIQNARLFREIETKSRELEVANQHKDEFLASMSHELRTPLNAIIGFSEVMLERLFGDVNAKQEEYLNDILSSGRHLLSLINDILDLAKIEAGRMELEAADFHLPQAIDNALVLVRERALRRGITLEQTIDPRLGEIKGDERKIKQVLLNLLSNAVKFTPEGGRIDVRATLGAGAAEISVADTGVGIAPEDHAAVFEEFRQVGTDYARKHEGTGLGLALARKFVELHGGTIRVESQLGQGATFTFTIPVTPWQAS
jgi:GAF domain-containing protein